MTTPTPLPPPHFLSQPTNKISSNLVEYHLDRERKFVFKLQENSWIYDIKIKKK